MVVKSVFKERRRAHGMQDPQSWTRTFTSIFTEKESKRKNTTRQQYASAYRKSKTPQRALFCVYSNAFSRIKYCESVPSNFLLECKRSPGINTCQWLPEGHLLGMPFVHLGLSFR